MKKIWYINIKGHKSGPFSFIDLKYDHRLTPDTLVWKEGFAAWKKIRDVPELKRLFADDKSKEDDKPQEDKHSRLQVAAQEEMILDLRREPPYLFWMLLVALLLLSVMTQLFWTR